MILVYHGSNKSIESPLVGIGIFTLLAIGIAGLVDSRMNYNRTLSL